MITTKEELGELYRENKNYIDFLIYKFLVINPTFSYMREDWEAEMALRFIGIAKKFDPDKKIKFSTFLFNQINFYLLKALAKEAKETIMVAKVISTAKSLVAGVYAVPFDEFPEELEESEEVSKSRMDYIDTTLVTSAAQSYDSRDFEDILIEGECTENQKEILRMYFIVGMTEGEIGEDLDITQQAAHNTIKRSLLRLRNRIEK